MSFFKRPNSVLGTLLLLTVGILLWSPVHGQDVDNVTFSAQGNMSGTPAVGIDYRFTDRTTVRFSLGYFRFNDPFSPCSYAEPGVFCEAVVYRATTHQVSSSLSGLYRLIQWSEASTYAGLAIQHLYAWAPERTGAANSVLADAKTAGNRASISGLVGLSVELESWLTLFGELGLGYVPGITRTGVSSRSGCDRRPLGRDARESRTSSVVLAVLTRSRDPRTR